VFTNWSAQPDRFFREVGFTVPEFLDLLTEIGDALIQPRDPDAVRPRQCKHTPQNRLLMVVYWLRSYPPYRTLENLFGVQQSNFVLELRHLLPILLVRIRYEIRWPTLVEQEQLRGGIPVYDGAVFIVDGTKTPVNRSRYQPEEFSGHVRRRVRNHQVLSTWDRTIVAADMGKVGIRNDHRMYVESPRGRGILRLADDAVGIGDLAYRGLDDVLTPFPQSVARRCPLRREFNRVLSASRSSIEGLFGVLKRQFVCLQHKWRHLDRHLLSQAALCSALLYNRALRLHHD